jgi:hypothetical protein
MSTYRLRARDRVNLSSRLPVELLNTVINFVCGKRELYQLCQASKLLRSMADQRLYLLYFGHSELGKSDIRGLLQHPRFETIVNTITIDLNRRPRSCRRQSPTGRPCDCDKLDKALGDALTNLLSLRLMRLRCHLCDIESRDRHQWLLTLKTRSLRELAFSCICSRTDEGIKKALEHLQVSCMESVVNLSYWNPFPVSSLTKEAMGSYCLDMGTLPNLRHIRHQGRPIHNILLGHRHVTRLSASLGSSSMIDYKSLWKKPGRLTHVTIQFNDNTLGEFFEAILADPTPFRNLQHIGSIPLVSLTCLVSYITSSYFL